MAKPLSPPQVATRVELAIAKIREASELITEVVLNVDNELARKLSLLAAGINDTRADILQAFVDDLETAYEVTLADEGPEITPEVAAMIWSAVR